MLRAMENIFGKSRGSPKNGLRLTTVQYDHECKSTKLKNKNNTNESKTIKKQGNGLISIWYTNADVLTTEKLRELTEDIDTITRSEIIAINEIKPKNYGRELNKIHYKISGYEFESVNLDDSGPTRGVALYIRNILKFSKLNVYKLLNMNSNLKEIISIEVSFSDNTKLLLSNIYRSPNSSAEENEHMSFFRNSEVEKIPRNSNRRFQ